MLPLIFLLLTLPFTTSQPTTTTFTYTLPQSEQEAVYKSLEAINPTLPWRTLYPDDFCNSSPHGILCGYFPSPHITELNFGYISDSSPNTPCTPFSLFPPSLTHLPHLRKLLFYNCFTSLPVTITLSSLPPTAELEELVFIENPSLSGPLSGMLGNFTLLRRLIITGSNVTGEIPDKITELPLLEQVTISGNKYISGGIPVNLGSLKKVKVLDLSGNSLTGKIPSSVGEMRDMVKLDISYNNLTGVFPESFGRLKKLEVLDVSYNSLGEFGVPRVISEMEGLKEVYLSGNKLGGVIPEIWEKLGGILGIGMSGVGLKGRIPGSMGVFLRNLSFVYLDGNELEGEVPKEFGELRNLLEVDLRGNNLSGRIPFSAPVVSRIGKKLKVDGNVGLCVDEEVLRKGSLGSLKVCSGRRKIAMLGSDDSVPFGSGGGSSIRMGWRMVVAVVAVAFWSFCWL